MPLVCSKLCRRRLGSAFLVPDGWRLRSVAVLLMGTVYVLLDEPLDFAENTMLQRVFAALVVAVLLRYLQVLRARV